MVAPFWFNTRAFSLFFVQREFNLWLDWMLTDVTPAVADVPRKSDADFSWRCWCKEQEVANAKAQSTTSNRITLLLRALPDLLLACAAVSSLQYEQLSKPLMFIVVLAATFLVILLTYLGSSRRRSTFAKPIHVNNDSNVHEGVRQPTARYCSCKLVTVICVYALPVAVIVAVVVVEKLLLHPPPSSVAAVASLGAAYNLCAGNPVDFTQGK